MHVSEPRETLNRRDFVKIAAAGIAFTSPSIPVPSSELQAPLLFSVPPIDPVRIGFVGVGIMGTGHLRNLLAIEGVEIKAVCDIVESKVRKAQDLVESAGQPRPTGYSRGPEDYLRLCAEEELDLVYTATPWELHTPICVAAIESGKHAATEVPAAITVEECFHLVETAEKHQKHCIMMENCCYGRTEMTVLNMVRQGLLGFIIHSECGYLHDIRELFLQTTNEREWFLDHVLRRDGGLYTTHGIGPAAQCMDINRGDQFDFLVSMSSAPRGLAAFAKERFSENDLRRKLQFRSGDVNTTLVRTKKGRTLTVVYNCNNPRPYSRINVIQGLKGIAQGYPDRIYIESVSPNHQWEPIETYWEKYEPRLWREMGSMITSYGHGGMDFLEDYRLIQCLRQGQPLDMDVYDAAAWSVIAPLSERSVAQRSAPMEIPDFTRGAWRDRPSLEIPGGA